MKAKSHGRNKLLRRFYQCKNHKAKFCKTKSINASYIESAVLDIVVDVIANTDLKAELAASIKSQSAFHQGMLVKSKKHLDRLNSELSAYVVKSMDSYLPDYAIEAFNTQIAKKTQEISNYTKTIEKQEAELAFIKSIDSSITKQDLESNRILALHIIQLIIKEIVYDESTDDFTITLL